MSKASEVQKNYAIKALANASAKGIKDTVVVLPVVDDEGNILPTAVHPTGNKGFGYIQLLQMRLVAGKGVEFINQLWAIQRGFAAHMDATYTPGMVLPGHIVIEDSLSAPNPANVNQDLKYINAACREAEVPCTVADQPIYQTKYWDRTGTIQDTVIPHDNGELLSKIQPVKANAGMDTAAQNAASRAARIAEITAIPKGKRTAEQKAELADLMD